jgi:hypothetical protein
MALWTAFRSGCGSPSSSSQVLSGKRRTRSLTNSLERRGNRATSHIGLSAALFGISRRSGIGPPESVDWECPQAVPEGKDLLPGVPYISGDQPLACPLGEVAQACQVFGADGGAGLYLDGNHAAVRGFQDRVYLTLSLVR